jgi:hypothetical protein
MEAGAQQGGAAGIDAETIEAIEQRGLGEFLAEIQAALRAGPISSFPGEAAIHTESRWKAAAIGDPDGAGPGGADGGEVGDGADL